MPGPFSYGGSDAQSTVITPTSTTGGASSPALAGDGALAVGNGLSIGKKGKQDNSVTTKVGNTTTTYTVKKGATLVLGQTPVGNVAAPAPTVVVPSGGGGADSSGVLASIANLVGTAKSAVTGSTSPVSMQTVKYILIAAFPIAALVIWVVFFRNKKST